MRKILPLSLLVALTLIGPSVSSVSADVITYTSESTFRGATPSHNPGVQSFENSPLSTNISSLNAAPMTITSQTPGVTFGVFNHAVNGAHATDGHREVVTSGSTSPYSINFHFADAKAVSSFGLYVTDFGDSLANATLTINATALDGSHHMFTIDATNGVPNADGNTQFFGLITNGSKFVDFQLTVSGGAIGFDEVYYDTENVPEPSTFALGAIGMMGLGFWRRKRAAA